MGGGGIKSTQNQEQSVANQYQGVAGGLEQFAAPLLNEGVSLQQPLINLLQSYMSPDPSARLTANAIPIGNIKSQDQVATDSIFNNVAPGAGRDFALAKLKEGEASQISGLLNRTYESAAPGLAQVGSGLTGTGLQVYGGALSALGGATGALGQIGQQQEQGKASTLGFLGSLAGAGARAATGGL